MNQKPITSYEIKINGRQRRSPLSPIEQAKFRYWESVCQRRYNCQVPRAKVTMTY